jgi:iron complex outermembrane receptor protein
MLDLHPAERIAVTGAVRLDHLWLDQKGAPAMVQIDPVSAYDRSITPLSFNAAATVRIGENGHFRLNGGRGFQLPSLVGLGLRVIVPAPTVPVPVFLTGDPDLAPVEIWSGEASYAHGFASGLQLAATLFYTRTDRLIASPGGSVDLEILLVPEPVAVTRFANVGAFTSYGAELSASGRISPALTWSANMSWFRVEEDIPANRDATFYALFPKAATPRVRANLGLAYADPVWFANGLAHFVTRSDQSSFLPTTELIAVRVPASVTLDAKIGRTLTRTLSVYAAGENLGKARGAYGSPIPGDRRVRLGMSVRL